MTNHADPQSSKRWTRLPGILVAFFLTIVLTASSSSGLSTGDTLPTPPEGPAPIPGMKYADETAAVDGALYKAGLTATGFRDVFAALEFDEKSLSMLVRYDQTADTDRVNLFLTQLEKLGRPAGITLVPTPANFNIGSLEPLAQEVSIDASHKWSKALGVSEINGAATDTKTGEITVDISDESKRNDSVKVDGQVFRFDGSGRVLVNNSR